MCGDYTLRREKRYVEVDVRFTPDGKIRPPFTGLSEHSVHYLRIISIVYLTSQL